MNAGDLLLELELLNHQGRMQKMVELGRLALSDVTIASTLRHLEQGDFYQRLLALQSCYGSGDGGHALRGLADPSRGVRALAINLLPLVGNDSQLQIALKQATFRERLSLLKRLFKLHRLSCIDIFINSIGVKDRPQIKNFIPFASTDVVKRHLETVLPFFDFSDWHKLTRRHSDLVVEELLKEVKAVVDFDPRLMYRVNFILPLLVKYCPEKALDVCRAMLQITSVGRLNLQPLVRFFPGEVAEIVLSSEDKANVSFDGVADQLGSDLLIALVTTRPYNINATRILSRLKPEQRRIVYIHCVDIWHSQEGGLGTAVIGLLPGDIRLKEARYHLNLAILGTRPFQRLPYASFLPWDEAYSFLNPFIRNPDPELRKAALGALVACVRYERSHLGDLLEIIKQRRNEQDPIRLVLLEGLAGLPPSIWQSQHLVDLSQIIADALNAADLSHATASFCERLVIAILPFWASWSAQELGILVQKRGTVNFYNLGDRLRDEDVVNITPALLPVLQAWETRERMRSLIALAASLGRRLQVFPGLVDILVHITQDQVISWIASTALSLLGKWCTNRFQFLIPQLLKQDPSWVTQPVVYNYLHRYRQDLLTPFLGREAYRGSFSTGNTRLVLPFSSGFYRWTPTQRQVFAETLTEVTQDKARDIPTIWFVIEQLAALPDIPATTLINLASASNLTLGIRDRALRALATMDAGQGLPTLIEALDDERSRVAIYALRPALLAMPTSQALSLLLNVSLERVTVAKEVVRLLGELASEEAYKQLLALDRLELHRDVRVALLRGFWSHLDRDETWEILEKAATSSDMAVATMVGRIPDSVMLPEVQGRFINLLATLLCHDDVSVRLDVLRRCQQQPVKDTEKILLQKFLACLNSRLPDECKAAANAIFASYSGQQAEYVGEAVKGVISNRRNLLVVVDSLISSLNWDRLRLLPTARVIFAVLASDPLTVTLRVKLAILALSWQELVEFFEKVIATNQFSFDVVLILYMYIQNFNSPDLPHLEAALTLSEDERLRRVALMALIVQAKSKGWNEELKGRLLSFREDSSAMVAAAAQFTLLPEE